MFWVCFHNAGIGNFNPLFLLDQQLTESQIGLILGLRSLTNILSNMIWTIIADHLHSHYFTMQIMILSSSICVLSLLLPYYVFHSTHLVPQLLVDFIYTFPQTAQLSMAQALVFIVLGPKKELFGKQRLWGAIWHMN